MFTHTHTHTEITILVCTNYTGAILLLKMNLAFCQALLRNTNPPQAKCVFTREQIRNCNDE